MYNDIPFFQINESKAVLIAGNGPSLGQIDYNRLPKEFDIFRCNQFYLEEEYFVGKKLRQLFFIIICFLNNRQLYFIYKRIESMNVNMLYVRILKVL